jgi:hypothetical protein
VLLLEMRMSIFKRNLRKSITDSSLGLLNHNTKRKRDNSLIKSWKNSVKNGKESSSRPKMLQITLTLPDYLFLGSFLLKINVTHLRTSKKSKSRREQSLPL